MDLQQAIVRQKLPFSRPLDDEQKRVLEAVAKWLKVNEGAPIRALPTIAEAVALMRKNVTVENRQGLPPVIKRIPGLNDHARVVGGDVENGVECGEAFFTVDGSNCRRDVIAHEFFHFFGIRHGGGALDGPTLRDRITSPSQAFELGR